MACPLLTWRAAGCWTGHRCVRVLPLAAALNGVAFLLYQGAGCWIGRRSVPPAVDDNVAPFAHLLDRHSQVAGVVIGNRLRFHCPFLWEHYDINSRTPFDHLPSTPAGGGRDHRSSVL